MSDYDDYDDYDDYEYDEKLCDYCGDNYTTRTYCSGWCQYRAEVRGPMKRETMKNIIKNIPTFEEKRRVEAEAENKPYVPIFDFTRISEVKELREIHPKDFCLQVPTITATYTETKLEEKKEEDKK
jgi:hypothetical protein